MDGIVYRRSALGSERRGGHEIMRWPSSVNFHWFRYAEIALNDYEKEQDAEFEIVGLYPYSLRPTVMIPEIDERCGDWVHISFIAIPRGTADADDVSARKLFFAELVNYGPGQFRVSHCSVLEPSHPGITHGCGICNPSKKIPHPSSGYLLGHWQYIDGEVPDSAYGSHWFKEETVGGSKRRQLDLDKLFKGNVPSLYVQRKMKSPEFAQVALELHKQGKNDAEFELVEGLGYSYREGLFIPSKKALGEWVHVNFTAKPKNADETSPPKLFFAELFNVGAKNKFSLAQCCILEPNDPGISYECGLCNPKKKIAHPPNYVAGHWPYRVPGHLY